MEELLEYWPMVIGVLLMLAVLFVFILVIAVKLLKEQWHKQRAKNKED